MGHIIGLRSIRPVREEYYTPALEAPDFAAGACLLGAPQPWQRSRWSSGPAAARVLQRLARSLPEAGDWPGPLKPGAAPDDNPFIPSVYSEFLRFVANDLASATTPYGIPSTLGSGGGGRRRHGMMLDALYGGGGLRFPSSPRDASGRETSGAQSIAAADPRHGAGAGAGTARFAALFSHAHAIIADSVQPVRAESRFAYARAIMLPIYHAIIRCDLLPRLLHPAVWRAMNERGAASDAWLWQSAVPPLEFAHGVDCATGSMTLGHNTLAVRLPHGDAAHARADTRSNGRGPCARSAPEWVAPWRQAATLGGVPTCTRRISPTRSSLRFRGAFPGSGVGLADTVPFRQAADEPAAPMWSVDAMICAIRQRSPDPLPTGWAFANPARRRGIIRQWLTEIPRHARHLTHDDLAWLCDDPPLPLFILLEAALDPVLRGRCLGILGSIILAEVVFRRLAEERGRLDMLCTAARTALPARLAAAVDGIDSLPGLVRFVVGFGSADAAVRQLLAW